MIFAKTHTSNSFSLGGLRRLDQEIFGSPEQRVIIKAYHEKQAKKRFRILSKFINP
jgi:hypothetical protein